jgi:glycosyltransferase involved in cell wall biosynthesis
LPPLVEPALPLAGTQSLDLPETYVLGCISAGAPGLELALDAWSWAAGPVGRDYPLLLVGVDAEQTGLARQAELRGVAGTLQALAPLPPRDLAQVVSRAAVVFHPQALPPWGSLLRLALALGKPLVAAQDPLTEAVVGPAAYLAPAGDARTLGAGILTLIVNEEVAGSLSTAAVQRAAGWQAAGAQPAGFAAALQAAYRQALA